MRGLSRRRPQPEVMDEPGLDPARHVRALRGLARINGLSNSAGVLWPALADLARGHPGRPLDVLDVACGGGDVTMRLRKRALRAGLSLTFTGCDLSPTAIDHAHAEARRLGSDVRFVRHDALAAPLPESDAVVCSLFLHHLAHEQAVELLRRMAAAARRLVLVNDLARGATGWLMAWVGTRMLTRSDVVHTDGPRSVEAAFTPAEALVLGAQAGMAGATVSRRWPCRFLLRWDRP